MRRRSMARMTVRLNAALAGVSLSMAIVSAQQPAPAARAVTSRQAPKAAAQRSARDIRSLINGVAVNGDRTPVPNATVRLRNLTLKVVEQVVTANEAGEFTFVAQPGVSYIVEVADSAGRTVAVGDVILVRAGEVAGAVVSLPSRLPPASTVFRDTTATVISAAANAGIGVVDPALPKVSPRQ